MTTQDPPSYWDLPNTDPERQKPSVYQQTTDIQLDDGEIPGLTIPPPAYHEAVSGNGS